MFVEIHAGRHGIDVHEHSVGSEFLGQPIEDATGYARAILAPVG